MGEPRFVLTPMVLGPSRIPVITDSDRARREPELAIMSALAHGNKPDPEPVFGAMFAALNTVDHDHAKLYYDVVRSQLSDPALQRLEAFMTTTNHKYHSEFARRYYSEGETHGKASAVLTILDGRGIKMSAEIRSRIATCTDLDQIDVWLDRAITADKIEDLDEQFASAR